MGKNAPEELRRFRAEAAELLGLLDKASSVPPETRRDDVGFCTLVLETDPGAVWAYERRGTAFVERKQWNRAAADFAQAIQRQPENMSNWYSLAGAHLGEEDLPAYRKIRTAMLARFGTTTDWLNASNMLYGSVAVPMLEESDQSDRWAKLAERSFPGNQRIHERIRGAIFYRAGKYEAALQALERAAKVYPRRAWDWLFLAMTHHQLGHTDQAKQCFNKAVEWIEEANQQTASGKRNVWVYWYESVEVPHLRSEAEALLKGN
jgi:tetratricopeptide (TPR) repeat protein